LIQKLQDLPETGMGYQRVTCVLSDGRRWEHVLVFNSSEMELPAGGSEADLQRIVDFVIEPSPGKTQ